MDNPVNPDYENTNSFQNTSMNDGDDGDKGQINSFAQDNTQEMQHLESELRMTLEEIARLQNALAEANMKLMAVTSTANSSATSVTAESLIQPMIKELRQPLVTV